MDETKPIWASKTVWGSVATVLGIVLPAFGVGVSPAEISHATDSLVNMLNDALVVGGFIMTIYGRVKATKSVSLSPLPSNLAQRGGPNIPAPK